MTLVVVVMHTVVTLDTFNSIHVKKLQENLMAFLTKKFNILALSI